MKKKWKIVVVSVLVAVILTFSTFLLYKHVIIHNALTGCLVFASYENTETLNIYDMENNTEKYYEIGDFGNIYNVGRYNGGDFCCLAKSHDRQTTSILLIKNGSLEKSVSLPYEIRNAAVNYDTIYFFAEDKLFSMEKSSLKSVVISERVYHDIKMNANGYLVFAKYKPGQIINHKCTPEIFDYYYLRDGKEVYIGEASHVQEFISEDEIIATLVTKSTDTKTYRYDTDIFAMNIITGEKRDIKLFRDDIEIHAVSSDFEKAVCLTPMYESTDAMYVGIVDMKRNIGEKSVLTKKLSSAEMSFVSVIWLDEDPFKNLPNNDSTIRLLNQDMEQCTGDGSLSS